MATCSTSDLLSASACFNGLPPYTLTQIQIILLCQILQQTNPMASCEPQDLLDSAACFNGLNPIQLQTIQAQLLCEILNGGSTTDTCITCGSGPPTEDATCDCSIYYDSDTGSPTLGMMWVWDGAAWFNISDMGGP